MKKGATKQGQKPFRFYVVIFSVGFLFTITLWDAYYNGSRPFDKEIASLLILIMGILFSVSAGLFSWSLETRQGFLEREVERRTRELHDKNEQLIKKNEEVENFIHIISHDLKAPIVSIQGFTSLLKTELGDALRENGLDYFHRIQANAEQMNLLIHDLLEFSRVGRVEDEKESVDMKELVSGLLEELKPEIDKKRVKVHVLGSLPPLLGSRKRLEQVFSNLLTNAIKYIGSPEEARIEIGSADSDPSGLATFWVKDNGVGIKKEFHEKIFQIFQRAPNRLNVEGTGIGLSIVKKIVELNGGRVWVESEECQGSQFYVTWPKGQSDVSDLPASLRHCEAAKQSHAEAISKL